ncbi:LAFE_0F06876g1_1 [Lachancea fermentati]|uniref:LAFE_0F06876g1_1 n=1 Tax=Lachancea fermentati TaxID=4955 RepID=A0A1G4MF34_LACFM|nr:LAFE_0F06876g1_1 [Lachancea fermentati]
MTAEENQYGPEELLLFSNNSLDIRGGFQPERSAGETAANTPVADTPVTLKNNKVSTPTAMNELLAMLEDNSMLSQLSSGGESQQQTGSNTNSNSNSTGLSPQQILQEGGAAGGGVFRLDEHSVTLSPSIDPPVSEQPCIDPNLLSNANSYIDTGIADDGPTMDSLLDDFTYKRRPSELATPSIPALTQSRGSISHSIDFWNLPHDREHQNQRSLGLLPSSSLKSQRIPESQGGVSNAPFKIDNELTQLLNDYNLSYAHQKPGKVRTSSFNNTNNSRRGSISELNRVQKQRASMSLVDGNNPEVISKLYGDISNQRPKVSTLSWENAVMSDEDDEEDSALPAQRFIHPNMLNNDANHSLDNTSFDIGGATNVNPNQTTTTTTNSTSPQSSHSSNFKRKRQSISKPRPSKSSSPLDEEEKPFKCQECTKAFRRSEHLKRHIRSVHSSERPFHCSYCDKKFSRSDNLSQHLKTHKKHGDF